jgi:hypothetical protein
MHGAGLVDIHFADGTIAYGCDPDWYVEIENGVVVNRLAYHEDYRLQFDISW